MKKKVFYQFNWIAPVLLLALILSGCAGMFVEPTPTPTSTPTNIPVESATKSLIPKTSPTITATIPPTSTATETAPDHMKVVDPNVLYRDDFTDPTSGWPEAKFDNYFIGYHEPEFYHVEVTSPNYKTTVFAPDKSSFDDVTVEVKALTASSKTAETGDYSFGVVFRRSGDQYYAFAISQRTKKWYVLKSAPNALTILANGTDGNIHDVDVADALRVDAQGSNFSFSINDQPVSQVSDSDYAAGAVGFFVQTFDAAKAHIHYDEITIKDYEPSIVCAINVEFLNVRSGPGTDYSTLSYLSKGITIEPLGRSANREWLMIALDEHRNQSWISNSNDFVTCNAPVDILPVAFPNGTNP